MFLNSDSEIANPGHTLGARHLGSWLLKRFLSHLDRGRLSVITPCGDRIESRIAKPGTEAVLVLHRWRAIYPLAIGGDLGFAESYIAGDWSSPDLTALIALAAENISSVAAMIGGFSLVQTLRRLRHHLRPNMKAGSRRNIAFHYDLGNDSVDCGSMPV